MKKYWFVIFLQLFGLYSGLQAQDGFDNSFCSSMINFVVVDGKLEFEVNEELTNKEGITVSQQNQLIELQMNEILTNLRTRILKLLLDTQGESMIARGVKLDQSFEEYRRVVEQIDDVVVIG